MKIDICLEAFNFQKYIITVISSVLKKWLYSLNQSMEEGFPEMVSEELMSMHNAKSRVWKTGDDRQATMGTPRRARQTGKGFLAWQI